MSRVTAALLLFIFLGDVLAQDPREFFKFAKFKYDNGDFEESLAFLNKAIKEDSLYVNAYYLRAEVNYELRQFYNSVLDINSILRLEKDETPSTGEYYLTRGKAFLALEDFANAESDFEKSNSLLEQNTVLYYHKAKLYFVTGEFDRALRNIDTAIQLQADKPDNYALRAEIKIAYLKPVPDTDEYQSILGDINVAIALDPNNYRNYLVRSNFLNSMGEVEEAVADYNTMIELSPYNEEAYTELGVIKMNNFEYKSALQDFTKSIKINPDDERNYRYRGLCNNNLNNYTDAYKDFSKSIDLLTNKLSEAANKILIKNTLAETYVLRGHCLNLMGNNAQACRDFLMAHTLGIKKGLNYYRKYCGIY